MISLILHTASPDDFLAHHGIGSAAAMVCAELERQPFRDFELIYVDRWRDGQPFLFNRIPHSFQVKHVGVHFAHRYWYQRGLCFIAAAKNTGLIYADGELCVSLDDGAVFNTNDFFQLYWDTYKRGLLLHAGYCRWRRVKTDNGLPVFPLDGEQYLDDTRHFAGHTLEHGHGNWLFTGASFPLESALKINGFNERFDGMKGLEDCDFGIRLNKIGHRFMMNRSVYAHILDHGNSMRKNPKTDGPDPNPPSGPSLTEIRSEVSRENYGVLDWADTLGETYANDMPVVDQRHIDLLDAAWNKYRANETKPTDAAAWQRWLNTPTFNLRQQRHDLRNSGEWQW